MMARRSSLFSGYVQMHREAARAPAARVRAEADARREAQRAALDVHLARPATTKEQKRPYSGKSSTELNADLEATVKALEGILAAALKAGALVSFSSLKKPVSPPVCAACRGWNLPNRRSTLSSIGVWAVRSCTRKKSKNMSKLKLRDKRNMSRCLANTVSVRSSCPGPWRARAPSGRRPSAREKSTPSRPTTAVVTETRSSRTVRWYWAYPGILTGSRRNTSSLTSRNPGRQSWNMSCRQQRLSRR